MMICLMYTRCLMCSLMVIHLLLILNSSWIMCLVWSINLIILWHIIFTRGRGRILSVLLLGMTSHLASADLYEPPSGPAWVKVNYLVFEKERNEKLRLIAVCLSSIIYYLQSIVYSFIEREICYIYLSILK